MTGHIRTIASYLAEHVERNPEGVAYQFFKGSALVPERLTYSDLWEQAATLASMIKSHQMQGERTLVVCKSQRNFVIALFSCLLAGTIAVPTAPPTRRSLLTRFELIMHDAQARAMIFDCDELSDIYQNIGAQPLLKWDLRLSLANADHALLIDYSLQRLPTGAAAILQYTSGSTANPKGVVISHGNLWHNCAAIQEGMSVTPESSMLGAIPLFHDMGLVGGILLSMYSGCLASFLSPAEFVQYPERWLQIISTFRITISGGPNFLYDLAVRAIKREQLEDIDLSRWRVAFCGAEPIRASTMLRFTRRFKRYGFRPQAFYPCYGMAESTLFITGARLDTVPRIGRCEGARVVGCGRPRHDTQVLIVDPQKLTVVADGCIGEIWVRGKSVATGYWMQPELTEKIFNASVSNGGQDRFLRTGDMGYLIAGELYVTGRCKDLIIMNGKKYAPQDVEEEAERSHDGLRPAGGAAFSYPSDNGERLVLVCELKRQWLRRRLQWPAIHTAIRVSVGTAHGITVDDIVLITPGSLPRTSSGKVRRGECRAAYLSGTLQRAESREI
jgi:acyl-CoA synthetase (AMP-forming)/AMP-acid ligase II